ncbi:MAG: hypothetical protein ABGX27_04575 [Desulfurobacteriaceae bacterium]
MRLGAILTVFTVLSISIGFITLSVKGQEIERKEAKKEIARLEKLKKEVEKLLEEKKAILKKIEEERENLKKEREEFEKRIKEIEKERYKKLAKVFEKMDPELAGQKISAFSDPKKAAYILYNMKPRAAGEVLNYVDPPMVDKIVKILTEIRKQAKKSQELSSPINSS